MDRHGDSSGDDAGMGDARAQAFAALLASRNIAVDKLAAAQPARFARWQAMFAGSHPDSFLAQVRFEINAVRRALQADTNADTNANPNSHA